MCCVLFSLVWLGKTSLVTQRTLVFLFWLVFCCSSLHLYLPYHLADVCRLPGLLSLYVLLCRPVCSILRKKTIECLHILYCPNYTEITDKSYEKKEMSVKSLCKGLFKLSISCLNYSVLNIPITQPLLPNEGISMHWHSIEKLALAA